MNLIHSQVAPVLFSILSSPWVYLAAPRYLLDEFETGWRYLGCKNLRDFKSARLFVNSNKRREELVKPLSYVESSRLD